MRLTVAELIHGTQGALVTGSPGAVVTGVSIDSRTCPPGAAFFAIRGARHDGHAFLGEARARGAAAVVVARVPEAGVCPPDFPVVLVEDTTLALGRLAAAYRRRYAIPVVAVTGSNGKTTTKELTALALGARFRVLKAAGSLNNQWGVPLALLGLEPAHEAAVLELGMNAPGEIAALARMAGPTVGVVTTVGPAHLAFLGSLEGVQRAKGELVEAIPADGTVVLNADDPRVAALARRAQARVVTYGSREDATVRVSALESRPDGLAFTVAAGDCAAPVRLPLPGRHNAGNAAAALAVAWTLGVDLPAAAAALGGARPLKGRLAWREAGGVRVLDDTYNANPASLRAALDVLAAAPGGRAWILLGDMLELGPATEAAHREAGQWVAALPAAGLAAVGPAARAAAAAAAEAGCPEVTAWEEPEAAAAHLAARLRPGDRVLVKGSRGMQMERAVAALLEALGASGAAATATAGGVGR